MNKRTIQRRKLRKFLYQKIQREKGFNPEECWNLDYTIIDFVLPRLKYFAKHTIGYPADLTPEKWNKILEEIIEGFEIYTNKDWYKRNNDDDAKIEKAFDNFHKWFQALWW